MLPLLIDFINIFIIIIIVLIMVSYLTLAERKYMAAVQRRIGPNVVGWYGLLQPIIDGLKLVIKEGIIPIHSNKIVYYIASIGNLFLALILWFIIPIGPYQYIDLHYDLLYILAISSISIISVLLGGWSSNTKYSFLGALRSSAQMISYEVIIGLIIICVIFGLGSSPNITKIIEIQTNTMNMFPLFPLFILFLIAIVAETSRAPFDLQEAESELVSGFNTDYSATLFALFFISEYSNIIYMSLLTVHLFLGGHIIWLPFILMYFIWIRASFPRLRYTDLISICWEALLPLVIGLVILVPSIILCNN